LWTQLDRNEWLFVAPTFDVLNVLCSKHEPTDVKLIGTGKLHLNSMCKAYGNRILIQLHAMFISNRTSKEVIPPLSCCGSVDKTIKLSELHLQISLRSVTNSLDDMKIASHKVEDVEKLIFEQDWQITHSTVDSQLKFFVLRHH
jgi:hypothetical protein